LKVKNEALFKDREISKDSTFGSKHETIRVGIRKEIRL
jgi:hypothetical protein